MTFPIVSLSTHPPDHPHIIPFRLMVPSLVPVTCTNKSYYFFTSHCTKQQNVLGNDSYNGTTLVGRIDTINSTRKQLLRDLLASLSKRFEIDSDIMKASRIVQLTGSSLLHSIVDISACLYRGSLFQKPN